MRLPISKRKQSLRSLQTYAIDSSNDGRIVKQFFNCLDTDLSRSCATLFTEGKHLELLSQDINPLDYVSGQADLFHRDYLAISFLSKSESLSTGIDKKEKALAKFRLMEEQCKATNQRFRSFRELENSPNALLLFAMRRKIDLVLSDFDVEEFFDKSSWGPGSTTLIRGSDVSGTRKYQSETGITHSGYALMGSSLAAAYPLWFREEHVSDSSVTFEEGNKIITVPKNSKTDRVIAVEPGLNLFFQKGIGSMIKSRLKRFGVDLTSQARNQKLAKQGSITGLLATVDFSSASDSIAFNVVKHLLPEKWFHIMSSLRCQNGKIDGSILTWEKFSSMGNAFTFELESLIFWAAACAVCDEADLGTDEVCVFGDDVIIPSSVFSRYEDFCAFLGFTVNDQKSFSTGHFRESCGAHFFEGIDVKPIYHKKELSDAFSVFKLANSIRRLAHRRRHNDGCDVRFLGTWRRILQGLPSDLRGLKIPEGYGDGGVSSNFDEATPDRLENGYDGYFVLQGTQRSARIEHDCPGLLNARLRQIGTGTLSGFRRNPTPRRRKDGSECLTAFCTLPPLLRELEGLSVQGYGNDSDLRGRTTGRIARLEVRSWYNFGEWI